MLKEIEKPRQHTGDTHQAHKPRAVKGAVKKRVHTCRRGDVVSLKDLLRRYDIIDLSTFTL